MKYHELVQELKEEAKKNPSHEKKMTAHYSAVSVRTKINGKELRDSDGK